MVIQEGALQNLVVSVKTRPCRELNGWAGIWQNTAGPLSPSGQEVTGRLQPHATNSTRALLPKLLLSSRALPEAWQQAIIPAVYMPTTAPPRQFCSSDSRCNKPVFLEDLLPFCPALSLPWVHHCFTAKLANRLTANLWPMFAAISDQRPSSCHGTSYTCRNRTAPRRISPPYSGPERLSKMQSQER